MSLDMNEQYEKIYKYCYFKTQNATVAEDLTQEAFLRYFSQSTYINRGKQLAYLYTIARNLCIDTYKSKKTEMLDEDFAASNSINKLELQIAVKEALQILPPIEQEIILLRYVNDMTIGEICNITGLSRFAVYRRTSSALAQLKSVLKEDDFFE